MKKQTSGFSIIEVLIGILIFSTGLVAIYSLIVSTLRVNDYNSNYIVASNLAREQIELIKNIRESNYVTIHNWNQINPAGSYSDASKDFFLPGNYYKIENDFDESGTYPVQVEKISDFAEGATELTGKMQPYRLCMDTDNRYTYDCSNGNTPTIYYKFIALDTLQYMSGSTVETVPNAFKVKSKVIWYMKGYHEVELDTLLTDWKSL